MTGITQQHAINSTDKLMLLLRRTAECPVPSGIQCQPRLPLFQHLRKSNNNNNNNNNNNSNNNNNNNNNNNKK